MFPAESSSPQAHKQVALRGFDFLHHRAAMCLSYWEPLNTLGSSSNVFCGHREITESSHRALSGRESSILVVHPAPTGACPQHPTHPSFPRSSITLSAFLWLLLMKHSGLRNEARPKASHSPCHKTDTGPALAAARGGAGGCSCSAPTGRKALQSYFYPRHCRTRSSSRQLSVFFLFFPLLVSCLRSIPREPGQRSCFGRRGLRS